MRISDWSSDVCSSDLARALAREGACVAVADILDPQDFVSEISKGGGRSIGLRIDVSRKEDCVRMVADTVEAFGRVDVLVNNAEIGRASCRERVCQYV